MTLQDAFEKNIPAWWRLHPRPVHERRETPYKMPSDVKKKQDQPPRRKKANCDTRIAQLLASSPAGLMAMQIRGPLMLSEGAFFASIKRLQLDGIVAVAGYGANRGQKSAIYALAQK